MVVAINETSRRNQFAGAFLASLPITSILAISWFYYETSDNLKTARLATDIMLMVIPSLTFFFFLSFMLNRNFSYLPALGTSSIITFLCYVSFLKIIGLFPSI